MSVYVTSFLSHILTYNIIVTYNMYMIVSIIYINILIVVNISKNILCPYM
jgi:hypothetical protein